MTDRRRRSLRRWTRCMSGGRNRSRQNDGSAGRRARSPPSLFARGSGFVGGEPATGPRTRTGKGGWTRRFFLSPSDRSLPDGHGQAPSRRVLYGPNARSRTSDLGSRFLCRLFFSVSPTKRRMAFPSKFARLAPHVAYFFFFIDFSVRRTHVYDIYIYILY